MIYQVDLTIFPKPLIHYKFRQIQQLAMNRGWQWKWSGFKEASKYDTPGFPGWHMSLDFNKKEMNYECGMPTITYKEAIQKLKALQ